MIEFLILVATLIGFGAAIGIAILWTGAMNAAEERAEREEDPPLGHIRVGERRRGAQR